MNVPKYLINSFAIIGVFSFIFFACAAADGADSPDSPDGDMNNPPAAVSGRYQISSYVLLTNSNNAFYHMDVLDTETGIVKHFVKGPSISEYRLSDTTVTQ
jgi:hypothetical protein